jgi:hypothetical protein
MLANHRPSRRRQRHQEAPDAPALCAAIRALWHKERRLGHYVPADELCLDLTDLDSEALRALRAQVALRLRRHLAAQEAAAVPA